MAAPGAEASIYAHPSFRMESRVIVGLDYPALTEEVEETFSGALDPRLWAYSWVGGASPLISGGAANFRAFGVPPFEYIRTREVWVPDDYDHPFVWEFGVTFPAADPVYSPMIIAGGIRQDTADLGEPLIVYQHGSATTKATTIGDTNEGDAVMVVDGAIVDTAATGGQHDFAIEWDPLTLVNANIFTFKLGGATVHTSDDIVRPEYIQFGHHWTPQTERSDPHPYIEPLGSASSPETIMQVHYVRSTELGHQGYESRVYPVFTFPNDGGDQDTAEPGERFVRDGMTCTILPSRYVRDISLNRGSEGADDRARIVLNPDADEDILSQRWVSMPVTVDTRRVSGAGTSSWKRQAAVFVIDDAVETSERELSSALDCLAMPHAAMGVYQERYWRGDSSELPGVNTGYTMAMIWQDIIESADATYGAPIASTDYLIRAFDLLPSDIGTGGESLRPLFNGLIDTTAHETYIDYPDTDSYGRVRVHAGTLGSGTADYTIPASPTVEARVRSVAANPGQAHYRQNLNVADRNGFYNLRHLPLPGSFPYAPMPSRARVLNDSIAFSSNVQATAVQQLRDKDNNIIVGGIAQHRYRYESTRRRLLTATLRGHDYIEPGDEIEIEGAKGALDGETFVVSQIEHRLNTDGEMVTRITARTSDWARAIRRAA